MEYLKNIYKNSYGRLLLKAGYDLKYNKRIFELTFKDNISKEDRELFKSCLSSVIKENEGLECVIIELSKDTNVKFYNTINEKLELLNKLEIIDISSSCGELEYILVSNNEKNRSILNDIGASEEDIKEMSLEDNNFLDISDFSFNFCDYFSYKTGFMIGNL